MPDPRAALRPLEIDVTLGEWTYTIPAYPADRWMEAVLDPDGFAIVPGLLNEADRADVFAAFIRGELPPEEIAAAAQDALEAAAGRYWWEADRLLRGAANEAAWPLVSGELLRRGVRLDVVSLGALCNMIYAHAVANATEEQRRQLDAELSMIPPGVDLDELYDEEDETAAFFADVAAQTESTLEG